jgi:hypothetical protein
MIFVNLYISIYFIVRLSNLNNIIFTIMISQKRLAKEIQKFEKSQPDDMSIATTETPNKIIATIKGPRETFWA